MDLQIEGQHTEVASDVHSWIAEHLEALDAPYHDILHGRVTLVKSARHRHGSDEARVVLTLAGKTLSATGTLCPDVGASLIPTQHQRTTSPFSRCRW